MNGTGKQVVVAMARGRVGSGGGTCLVGMTHASVMIKRFLSLIGWVAQHRECIQCCYIITHFRMADFVFVIVT